MTRRICFRLAGDTGVADMSIAGGSQSQLSRRFGNIKEQCLGQGLDNKTLKMTDSLAYVVRKGIREKGNDSS